MRTLKQLSTDIGQWADSNFGDKRDGYLGICEELGEFAYADESDTPELIDALCDILIFALDLAYCEKIPVWVDPERLTGYGFGQLEIIQCITIGKGTFAECELKNIQVIRNDESTYHERRTDALNELIVDTLECLGDYVESPIDTLNETFDNNVSKRNWKLDPKNGGGYTHEKETVEDRE